MNLYQFKDENTTINKFNIAFKKFTVMYISTVISTPNEELEVIYNYGKCILKQFNTITGYDIRSVERKMQWIKADLNADDYYLKSK